MSASANASHTGTADRVLRRLGVRPRPYRALLRAYVLMDFRSQQFGRATASKPKDLITPLFWVVGQYLLLSVITCAVLFARVDAYFFALVNLGVSMLVMGTSLVVEFNEVVLDADDLSVVGHRPVPLRTYSAARLTNLLGYVLLMTAALNLFPAIIGLGLRDASWAYLPAYVAAALVGNLAVVGVLLLLYTTLLSGRPSDAVREALAWTQTILIMVAFYGGQAVLRDGQDRLEMAAYSPPGWLGFLPPAWLAHFVDSASSATAWWILGAGVLFVAAVWALVLGRVSAMYGRMEPGGTAWRRATLPALAAPGTLGGRLTGLLTRTPQERAAFWLCSAMLRRDHDLRMRSWPTLGVTLALALLGLFTNQLGDPFVGRSAANVVLPVAALYLLAYPVPAIIHNLNFSRDHAASWLLWSAPVGDRFRFTEGLRKAVTYRIMLPLLVALLVVFAFVWRDLWHALMHTAAGWLVVVGAGHAAQIGLMRRFPFSASAARGSITGGVALFAGAVNATAMSLAVAHYFAAASSAGFAVYLAALAALVLALRATARRVVERRFAAVSSYE
jgi:hypothetical protein